MKEILGFERLVISIEPSGYVVIRQDNPLNDPDFEVIRFPVSQWVAIADAIEEQISEAQKE